MDNVTLVSIMALTAVVTVIGTFIVATLLDLIKDNK